MDGLGPVEVTVEGQEQEMAHAKGRVIVAEKAASMQQKMKGVNGIWEEGHLVDV